MEVKRVIPIVVASVLGVLLLITAVASVITVVKVFGIANSVDENASTTPAGITTTTAPPQPGNDTVNVNDPEVIDKSSARFPEFLAYSQWLGASMNLTREPCTDFFEYVCEGTNEDTIDDTQTRNEQLLLQVMNRQP
uniref:Neutral zinc metallopeptidase n=2 Tax=Bursaphelenchus xylophilus TaxID=6326 RepID=A0A1I7SG36_BURXY